MSGLIINESFNIDNAINTKIFIKRTSGDWSRGTIINMRSNYKVKIFLIFLDDDKIKQVKYWSNGNYMWNIISDELYGQIDESWSGTISDEMMMKKIKGNI